MTSAEKERGLPAGSISITCTLESAPGVLAARELAGSPRVRHLTFGAADFVADVGVTAGADQGETLHARSHLVVASAAAGHGEPAGAAAARGLHGELREGSFPSARHPAGRRA